MTAYVVRVPGRTYQELRVDARTITEAREIAHVWLCGENDDENEDAVEVITDLGEAPFRWYAPDSWLVRKEPTP